MIAAVEYLLTQAFREHSPTVRGQLVGVALIVAPAATHPLPLGADLHTAVQVVAVIAGFLGAVIVFGGLALRVLVATPRAVLLALPQARAVRNALTGLALVFAAGALWCLVLAVTRGWSAHLAEVLMLGLPAATLGRVAWWATAADPVPGGTTHPPETSADTPPKH